MLAAVRQLNQVELVGESVRACVEALSAADPDWVAACLDASWQRRYGARVDSWRMPASKTKRAALGADYARDGVALLPAVWIRPRRRGWRSCPRSGRWQRVLIQNVVVEVDRGGREVIDCGRPTRTGSRLVDAASSRRMTRMPAGAGTGSDLARLQAARQ